MTIPEIAVAINQKSVNYNIGKLQLIRKQIKGLDRQASRLIFNEKSIHKDWAFHYGGRTEIQFNIGLENEGVRYGLAFSLEPSQSLPDVSILYPKILKLNCLIQEDYDFFTDYQMWHWQNSRRSGISKVTQIQKKQIQTKTFLFFGKIASYDNIDIDEILRTFDDLLPIYRAIEEGELSTFKADNIKDSAFIFKKTFKNLPKRSTYSSVEREINITIRHSLIQEELQKQLEEEYGQDNVSLENDCRGNRIDIVVKQNNDYYFYEVKVGSSAKSCIRQGLGQILEYAYGDSKRDAVKLVIVGEPKLNSESKKYINFLNTEFGLPINYLSISA